MARLGILAVVLLLSACTVNNQWSAKKMANVQAMPTPGLETNNSHYVPRNQPRHHSNKAISDYAEQLAVQLFSSMRDINPTDAIAVTSLVRLDSQLSNTNLFGNQLAEELMTAMQDIGFMPVDVKTMDSLKVSANGDFIFSRDTDRLAKELDFNHVIAGTILETHRGYRVNARIIHLESKSVLASGGLTIPKFVIKDIYRHDYFDGQYLGQKSLDSGLTSLYNAPSF